MMIYEERRAVLRPGTLPNYRRLLLDRVWPALSGLGGRPLCLLSGLIGMPATETYMFTGLANAELWQAVQSGAQDGPSGGQDRAGMQRLWDALALRSEFVIEEQVRLLRPSALRPKDETPLVDRCPVYGMRRFTIRTHDWPDFERLSAEGIWPRIEHQDACVLGLFRDAAHTDPVELTLLTGYRGPAHWEETRGWNERPATMSEDLWELGRRNSAARNAITLRSHVCLMNAHWPSSM